MREWTDAGKLPCCSLTTPGDTHLLVASTGGWSILCGTRPEKWQDMLGNTATEPLIIARSDEPTCTWCLHLLKADAETDGLGAHNWPITWKKVDV